MRSPRQAVRGSVRARMTLLYGGLFTVITLSVLGAVVWIQKRILDDQVSDGPFIIPARDVPCDQRGAGPPCSEVPFDPVGRDMPKRPVPPDAPLPPDALGPRDGTGRDVVGPKEFHDSLAGSQRLVTLVAIAVIIVLAFAVSWWLTGRLLRPLTRITATARLLSLSTLHERIALTGPDDELKELADTFDAMLDRLEQAIDSQRRFVANASHELRTPLAIQRTAIEVGLADPDPARLAEVRDEMLRNTRRSERLIEGLLVLAQGERGLDARAPVDLASVAEQVVDDHAALAARGGVSVSVSADVRPVTVAGDEVLLTRMAANLVQNAIRHNHPGGRVEVEVSADGGLTVRNTGPQVPPERVHELFEPFRRLHADRTGSADGAGLGLSIVAAIVHAHGGTVRATAGADGGLTVAVALPVSAPVPAR
ncbi:sensor histidine kinase [Actinomadura syzygii]|nr:HAMP domain-containing sensor histidine kinase [Actinomadura syzygii]